MANLSNINDKFLVTTGGNVLIGGTAVVGTAKLQVTGEARVFTGSNLGYWGVDAGNSYVYLGTNSSAYGLSLQTGGIDRVNINDAGNVFISTPITNAFYGLSLTYNSNNTADFTVNQATGQIKIGGVATGYFPTFYAGGSEKMRIDTSGKSTFYSNEIEVYASSSSASLILNSGDATKDEWTIVTTDLAGDAYLRFVDTTTATTVMSLRDNGNVGIGTNSPLHNLQIGTAATNGSYSMMIEGNFANTALSSNPRLNLIDTNFGITAGKYGSGGSDDAIGIFAYQGTGRGILFAHTTAGSTTTLQNMRHDMFIDGGTGHVGIGTTSPSKKLEVAGSYKLGTNAYIQYDAGYPYTINMLNTAAVGNLILNAGAGSSGYESKIVLQGSNTAGAAGITLFTASSTRMVITADGKIGLDKSDPFYSVDATSFGANTHEWGSGLALFGQDRYSIRELNNLFYSADSRVGGIGTSSNLVSSMFDGNFDTGHTIAANTTYVVEMDGSGVWNMTYPSGYATISFYYIYTNFTSIVGEQYHYGGTYAGQWRTMDTAVDIRGFGGSTRVVRINSVGNNYVSKWRFTFVTGSSSITVTDIAFYATRTAGAPVSTYMRGDRTNEWTRTIRFRNNANGIVGSINPGNTSTTFNTTSDYRLKEDLKDFKGLDMVSKIPVYDFRWINSEKRSYGVLAHELNEIYPEAVEGEKDEKENQCVDYSKIVPLLVKAIQELKAEIELLKSK